MVLGGRFWGGGSGARLLGFAGLKPSGYRAIRLVKPVGARAKPTKAGASTTCQGHGAQACSSRGRRGCLPRDLPLTGGASLSSSLCRCAAGACRSELPGRPVALAWGLLPLTLHTQGPGRSRLAWPPPGSAAGLAALAEKPALTPSSFSALGHSQQAPGRGWGPAWHALSWLPLTCPQLRSRSGCLGTSKQPFAGGPAPPHPAPGTGEP